MSDETETTDDGWEGFESEEFTDSEMVEVEGAYIIAPRGWGWLADTFGAAAARVTMAKGGDIEFLISDDDGETWAWRKASRSCVPAKIKAIKSDG